MYKDIIYLEFLGIKLYTCKYNIVYDFARRK